MYVRTLFYLSKGPHSLLYHHPLYFFKYVIGDRKSELVGNERVACFEGENIQIFNYVTRSLYIGFPVQTLLTV